MDASEIEFLTWDELQAIHRRQLELFGGQDGFTDRGVVESAFNRPLWAANYGQTEVASLAAEYWFGLVTTQGFSDGNKRTATEAAVVFLGKNGFELAASDEELYPIALAVATGTLDRDGLAEWIASQIRAVQ